LSRLVNSSGVLSNLIGRLFGKSFFVKRIVEFFITKNVANKMQVKKKRKIIKTKEEEYFEIIKIVLVKKGRKTYLF